MQVPRQAIQQATIYWAVNMCQNMDINSKRLLTDAKLPLVAAFNPSKARKMHKETIEGDMTDERAVANQETMMATANRRQMNANILADNSRRGRRNAILTGMRGVY